jgi:cation-transporting ATPase 13A2
VPVSKVPCTNEALQLLTLETSSVVPTVSRHFLYCGTKIIRTRKPQDGVEDEVVGLAMVVRTGFNTMKGALVRSMLFPKPSGFQFYRDSLYYIAFMGLIAMIGFIASFVNFILLGVNAPPLSFYIYFMTFSKLI